jgi:tellurite resistance protein TerC
MTASVTQWAALGAIVAGLFAVDLLLGRRRSDHPSVRSLVAQNVVWFAIGLAFAAVVWLWGSSEAGEAYIAGYLVERSLSLDNVAVFAMLFTALAIPVAQRERILAWGIALALGLRIVMIAAGVALLDRFAWMVLVFGAFLLLTAWRMRASSHNTVEPETTLAYRALGRVMPIDLHFTGGHFFSRIDGRRAATPLFVAFLLVAALDVVFAVDSVPAILAITTDTYVVVAANAFALLGLRPLYGLLATAMQRVAELQQALAILLAWIGFKLIVSYWWHAPVWTSLLAIAVIIGQAVVRALLRRRRELREAGGREELVSVGPEHRP